jgi:hypothetical protein
LPTPWGGVGAAWRWGCVGKAGLRLHSHLRGLTDRWFLRAVRTWGWSFHGGGARLPAPRAVRVVP